MTATQDLPRRTRRPNGSPHLPVHSVRCDENVWAAAKRRATREGVTMSQVAATLIAGYAQHEVDLPSVVLVYEQRSA